MMNHTLLSRLHFPRHFHPDALEEWLLWVVIVGVAWAAGMLLSRLLLRLMRRLHAARPRPLLASLLQHRVSAKLAQLFPPLLAGFLLQAVYEADSVWLTVNERLAGVVFVVAVVRSVNALIESIGILLMQRGQLQNRPMKGVVEILQVVVSGVGTIVAVAILLDKSPLALLTGLSAFAAILMLLFRDTILGFVAGVMLAKSDMVRIGDRIVMERCGAMGTVIDIDLTTVKVQNMDYTLVTIPPYTLLTQSFNNWRPLYDDGRRRLIVVVWIRPESVKRVHFDDGETGTEAGTIMGTEAKTETGTETKTETGAKTKAETGTGTDLGTSPTTNLALFRQYLTGYLKSHPDILQDCLQMVRFLPMEPTGIPLQVYAFTGRVAYKDFNEMQSEVTEHVVGMMPEFGLEMQSLEFSV